VTLDQLKKHQTARVLGFAPGNEALINLLREIGFAESDEVELMHTGPFGAGPLCFRLNRTMIALRRVEAAHVLVEAAADA
jgi:ferrous iron transport protein A